MHIKEHKNEIYFFGELNEEAAIELNITLRKMKYSPIVLYIHSTGGDVYAGLSVMDHILALGKPVYTVADGICSSAASLILVAGTKRFMKPHARVLVHQVSSGSELSKFSDVEDEYFHVKGLMKLFQQVYTSRTKIPKKKLREFMKRDVYLNIDECLQYSIVDAPLDNLPVQVGDP